MHWQNLKNTPQPVWDLHYYCKVQLQLLSMTTVRAMIWYARWIINHCMYTCTHTRILCVMYEETCDKQSKVYLVYFLSNYTNVFVYFCAYVHIHICTLPWDKTLYHSMIMLTHVMISDSITEHIYMYVTDWRQNCRQWFDRAQYDVTNRQCSTPAHLFLVLPFYVL